MAKRFTATEKWDDPWFCGLTVSEKLFWNYLCDKCDHAGIWRVNWPLVRFHIGDFVFNKDNFKDRIIILSDDKWFIQKFIEFQYGTLNPENRAHQSVISILKKEGAYKGLIRGIQGRKDKDKDKDMDKDKDCIGSLATNKPFIKPTAQEVSDYAKSIGFNLNGQYFLDKQDSVGWLVGKNKTPMKDWRAVVRTWKGNGFNNGKYTEGAKTPSLHAVPDLDKV